jgi:hypothetical protein
MTQPPRLLEPAPNWTAEEKPTLPGSPAVIAHSTPKRFIYFFIGLFVAVDIDFVQSGMSPTATAAWQRRR